jgi:hypothetical protein
MFIVADVRLKYRLPRLEDEILASHRVQFRVIAQGGGAEASTVNNYVMAAS